jgi:hypothetical protein
MGLQYRMPGLFVVGDVDNAGVDEPVDVDVGVPIGELGVVHLGMDGRLALPNAVRVGWASPGSSRRLATEWGPIQFTA